MNRVILVIVLALSCAACSHLPPLPVATAPTPSARVEAAPAERAATFSFMLSVPLSELEALLRDQLSLPSAPDWQLVTEPKESPEVEVRYEAELLTPQIAIVGSTLIVKLQIAYFGSLRARVHTPFGWLRLSKGTHWGDRDQRALIELEVHTNLELAADYQLHAQSSLHEVKLAAPPIDQLCAGGAFKVCVPAEVAARPIHAELERRIRSRAESGLAHVDEQVRERASLASAAQRMWERLSAAQPALPSGETLQLRPRAIALSPPFINGDQVALAINLSAAPRFSIEPAPPASPPPSLGVEPPGSTFVPLSWLEPFAAIGEGLSVAARAQANEDGQLPTQIELLGPAQSEGRFLLALGLRREGQARKVYGEAELVHAGDQLKLGAINLTADSERLLALAKIDRAAFLAAAGSLAYRPSAALDARTRSLRALIADSLAPLPIDPLASVQPNIVATRSGPGGVWLEVELR
jgi:hypothetical protein